MKSLADRLETFIDYALSELDDINECMVSRPPDPEEIQTIGSIRALPALLEALQNIAQMKPTPRLTDADLLRNCRLYAEGALARVKKQVAKTTEQEKT